MEYTQWAGWQDCKDIVGSTVLILVVMEYTQWAYSYANRK